MLETLHVRGTDRVPKFPTAGPGGALWHPCPIHRKVRPMRDEVLTVQEVAQLLKTTPATVYAWCRAGKLPAFKIGQQWRIRSGALERLMTDGAVPAAPVDAG